MRCLTLIAVALIATNALATEEIDPTHSHLLTEVQPKLPATAIPVFDGGRLSDFRLMGQGPKADFSFVAVEGQLFSRAIRVKVNARTPNGWDVQVMTPPTTQPVKKGDRVMAVLHLRCATGADAAGVLHAFIQGAPQRGPASA